MSKNTRDDHLGRLWLERLVIVNQLINSDADPLAIANKLGISISNDDRLVAMFELITDCQRSSRLTELQGVLLE